MSILGLEKLCQGGWYNGKVNLREFWACPPFSFLLSSLDAMPSFLIMPQSWLCGSLMEPRRLKGTAFDVKCCTDHRIREWC